MDDYSWMHLSCVALCFLALSFLADPRQSVPMSSLHYLLSFVSPSHFFSYWDFWHYDNSLGIGITVPPRFLEEQWDRNGCQLGLSINAFASWEFSLLQLNLSPTSQPFLSCWMKAKCILCLSSFFIKTSCSSKSYVLQKSFTSTRLSLDTKLVILSNEDIKSVWQDLFPIKPCWFD